MTQPFLDWLPDVLDRAGVDTYVMPGAEKRTTRSDGLTVRGVVWHHTATGPNWQDGHVALLLARGRIDLAGPLSQVGIERDGTWVIVALGRANHNGYGTWGNDSLGLEFYNSGLGEPWPEAQVESGIRGTAAVLAHLGKSIHEVKGHRETDPRRKIDPAGLSMPDIRRRIDAAMRRPFPSSQEDDHMDYAQMLENELRWRHKVQGDLPLVLVGVVVWWSAVIAAKPAAERHGAYRWILGNEPAFKD